MAIRAPKKISTDQERVEATSIRGSAMNVSTQNVQRIFTASANVMLKQKGTALPRQHFGGSGTLMGVDHLRPLQRNRVRGTPSESFLKPVARLPPLC